jgi:hypothetical protein
MQRQSMKVATHESRKNLGRDQERIWAGIKPQSSNQGSKSCCKRAKKAEVRAKKRYMKGRAAGM